MTAPYAFPLCVAETVALRLHDTPQTTLVSIGHGEKGEEGWHGEGRRACGRAGSRGTSTTNPTSAHQDENPPHPCPLLPIGGRGDGEGGFFRQKIESCGE